MEAGVASVFDVANYFLAIVKSRDDTGELISNLKLQKLLYYAQGLYLAMHGEPLFSDEIEAWQYGPVVPTVYQKYKHSNGALFPDEGFDTDVLSRSVRDFLEEVYCVYGQFSAWKLVQMTHNEDPWIIANRATSRHSIVSKKSMEKFFRDKVE